MAELQQFVGTEMVAVLGLGDTDPGPETFAAVCGFEAGSKSLSISATTIDGETIDCDDLEALRFQTGRKDIASFSLSGDIKLAKGDTLYWANAVLDPANRGIKIRQPGSTAAKVVEIAGRVNVTQFDQGVDSPKGYATGSVTINSDGIFTVLEIDAP